MDLGVAIFARQLPDFELEIRHIAKVATVARDDGQIMDERCRSDHPVDNVASRIAVTLDDGATRRDFLRSKLNDVELTEENIEPDPAPLHRLRRTIDSAFEFNVCKNRNRRDTLFEAIDHYDVTVAERNRDTGVE